MLNSRVNSILVSNNVIKHCQEFYSYGTRIKNTTLYQTHKGKIVIFGRKRSFSLFFVRKFSDEKSDSNFQIFGPKIPELDQKSTKIKLLFWPKMIIFAMTDDKMTDNFYKRQYNFKV